MLACAESNFSNFKFEYLRENEFLSKTILACLSGAQVGSIHEKNSSRKSRDTASLKYQIHYCWTIPVVPMCIDRLGGDWRVSNPAHRPHELTITITE